MWHMKDSPHSSALSGYSELESGGRRAGSWQ